MWGVITPFFTFLVIKMDKKTSIEYLQERLERAKNTFIEKTKDLKIQPAKTEKDEMTGKVKILEKEKILGDMHAIRILVAAYKESREAIAILKEMGVE